MAGLTSIADRLTPSVPTEITFGAQPIGVGTKMVTLFGHKAASGGTGQDFASHDMINVGDAAAAQLEVDALAGTGSEIGQMAAAFVNANVLANRSNYPFFRVVLLPNAELAFGTNQLAFTSVKTLRSDMLVSCYPASDASNATLILNFATQISGVDRDLSGQFGTEVCFASLEPLANQLVYDLNTRGAWIASLPDSNSATVTTNGTYAANSNIVTGISPVGVYQGAVVSSASAGIPAGTTVLAVDAVSVTLSVVATASHSGVALTFVNQVSQSAAIVAAAAAAAYMSFLQPYVPMQGVAIGGLVPPAKKSDWVDINPSGDSEAMLVAGLSPLVILPGNVVGFLRTRTTYTELPSGITATSYIDVQDQFVLYDFREELYQIAEQPPFNNNPGGAKASDQMAAKFKDEMIRLAFNFEDRGMFQNVKQLSKYFVVQKSLTSRGRFDCRIPVDVIPGLYVIATNIVAGLTEDFTI